MSGPYFQRYRWPAFTYQGLLYTLEHLDEYIFKVCDSQSVDRQIVVTFGDHCFTRNWVDNDDVGLIYPESSRPRGCFCIDRYQLSLNLRAYIERAVSGQVWNTGHDNYALVPTITHDGRRLLYAILFSLDPVKGLPVDLHMRVKTAYPCDRQVPATFGSVRFRHLVTLRLQRKRPKKISDRGRKRPSMT